jgi:phosphatidylglycerol:prolipoprotein diacylglycerol transferase
MFSTLGDLIEYIFHIHIQFPIQTFGFFVALSFFFSYFIFVAELKRKEADGWINSYTENETVGQLASLSELIINGVLGFLLGFKVIGCIFDIHIFLSSPLTYVFSLHGSWIGGILVGVIFVIWIYFDRKKQQLAKPVIVERIIHPYQLMLYLAFMLGFWGFIGAKLFNTIEDIQTFVRAPFDTLFSSTGFTYYGGLIFGALAWLYILHKKGVKLIHAADIGSPGMMLAYGIGRIGCQLSGDGDWGIINRYIKPHWLNWMPDWMWSFKFPHNVANAGMHIPGCIGDHCNQLRFGVYPTSFYEAVVCIGLFGLMWIIRKKIKVPGLMFYIFLILNGTERFLIEMIRVTDKYHIFNITITQAQVICLFLIAGGVTGIVYLVITRSKPVIN